MTIKTKCIQVSNASCQISRSSLAHNIDIVTFHGESNFNLDISLAMSKDTSMSFWALKRKVICAVKIAQLDL